MTRADMASHRPREQSSGTVEGLNGYAHKYDAQTRHRIDAPPPRPREERRWLGEKIDLPVACPPALTYMTAGLPN
jgi:hypothetical protein